MAFIPGKFGTLCFCFTVLIAVISCVFSLYYSADTAAAFLLAMCTINTMWPLGVCSGKVLLNTTPPYVLAQLDKLLSEAQTLGESFNDKFRNIDFFKEL